MDENLSPAAQRALAQAGQFAATRGATVVEAADLFAAVLAVPESTAAALLRRYGIDGGVMKPAVCPKSTLPTETAMPTSPNVTLAPAVAAALSRAKQLAVAYSRHEQAGSEEIAIALLEADPAVIPQLAEQRDACRRAVDEYHRQRAPASIPVDVRLELDDPLAAQSIDVARIVDAGANRLAEALRVIEDYARFALDDRALCARLKDCRHRLREALEFLPASVRWVARETESDVGTALAGATEYRRDTLTGVVEANCQRAQEAARSLEEFAKLHDSSAARSIESIRYELYTIERLLGLADRARGRLADVRLYWLLEPDACCKSLDWMVEEASAGGVDCIQLRDKTAGDRERLALARELRGWTRERQVLFIVNDRPDLARLANADGVHLGQDDLPVREARRIVGPEALVGVSTHDIDQARRAVADGADYIGVGPVFASQTKAFASLAGVELVRQVAAEIRLPAFCIGGIDATNLPQVLAAGGQRIAISGCLCKAPEPRATARRMRGLLDGGAAAR